jgi:hypothetical protein
LIRCETLIMSRHAHRTFGHGGLIRCETLSCFAHSFQGVLIHKFQEFPKGSRECLCTKHHYPLCSYHAVLKVVCQEIICGLSFEVKTLGVGFKPRCCCNFNNKLKTIGRSVRKSVSR